MTYYVVPAAAIAALDDIHARLNAGSGAGKLKIYDDTGTIPTATDASLGSNVLLATLTLSDPAAASGASDNNPGAILTLDTITGANAVADGDAAFFRLTDSDDNVVAQGTITASGGGGDLELINLSIASGQPVQVSSLELTHPEGV